MTSSFWCRTLALVAALGVAGACGKKGPPLAPLRPVPSVVSGFSAERLGLAVTLRFAIPAGNTDGSEPPSVERVEIHAVTLPADALAPTPAQLIAPANLAATIGVRKAPEEEPGAAAPPDPRPVAGEVVTHVDAALRVDPAAPPSVRYYVASGLTGRRRGPHSTVLAVPLTTAPASPADVTARFTEQAIIVTWTAAAPAQRFIVEGTDSSGAKAARLTPEPVTAAEFSTPVEFGRERCFAVRAVEGDGGVVIIGAPAAPVCVTPVDRFAPPAPAGLLAVAGDGAVELLWTASSAPDLAGYLVLRAEGVNGTLQRLTPSPITETQYRDQGVRPGVVYAYVVVAVDRSTPPNESAPSNRQVVTSRPPAPGR